LPTKLKCPQKITLSYSLFFNNKTDQDDETEGLEREGYRWRYKRWRDKRERGGEETILFLSLT
jgi:hypothetical protein